MANIDRLVKVDIALNTTGITSEGFSTMIVVGPHAYTTTRVLSIADNADELLDFGFTSDDLIYKAVSSAFKQTPRPTVVKVGRLQCDTVKVGVKTAPATGLVYKIAINSIDANGDPVENNYEYTAQDAEAVTTVLNGLASAITSDSKVNTLYTATVTGENLIIKANDPAHSFSVKAGALLKITGVERADMTIAENMALITAADSDFYGVAYTDHTDDAIMEMAEWNEAHKKLYVTATNTQGAKNAEIKTDILSKLMNKNYYATACFYHENVEEFAESAEMARCFSILPGGETWANKKLAGITTDNLTETEFNAIKAKNGNTFERFRNVAITQRGITAGGEWIDVIRFRDWLEETIKTEVFSSMINMDKLPYTDAGIAIIEGRINAVLELGQNRGGIAPTEYDENGNKNYGFTISVPKASSISANVKAQRILQDVKFTARLAGAIHAVEIKGSLTYENLQDAV